MKYQSFRITFSTALFSNREGLRQSQLSDSAYEMLILSFCFFINSQQAKGLWNNYVNFRFIWTREIILNDDSGKCDREDLYRGSFL